MKKLRKQSKELLSLAQKVTAYRRDLMSTEAQQQINLATVQLSTAIQDHGATEAQIQEQQRVLERLLKEHGGILYGKGFFGSLVEDLLVAVIVIIGIRSFFFQPFIIPTNSMYPTYSGMNSIVYTAEDAPSAAMRLLNTLRFGVFSLLSDESHIWLSGDSIFLACPQFTRHADSSSAGRACSL